MTFAGNSFSSPDFDDFSPGGWSFGTGSDPFFSSEHVCSGSVSVSPHGIELQSDCELPVGTALSVGISKFSEEPFGLGSCEKVLEKTGLVVDCHPTLESSGSTYDLTIFFLDDDAEAEDELALGLVA